jgi:hypothetical protein
MFTVVYTPMRCDAIQDLLVQAVQSLARVYVLVKVEEVLWNQGMRDFRPVSGNDGAVAE